MKPITLLTFLLLLSTMISMAEPRKERLRLKETATTTDERQFDEERRRKSFIPLDSAEFAESSPLVTFAGFDKNASSGTETFLISNHSAITIRALRLTIIYRDMSGRMLHKRTETFKETIPPDETRLVSIPAIDRQKNLYCHKSKPPRKGGMPFEVEIILESLSR